jgi:PAS domain S-box-containing protein
MSASIYRVTLEKYYRRTYSDQIGVRVGSVAFVAGITTYLGAWPWGWAALWALGFCATELAIIGWWVRSKPRRETDEDTVLARLYVELIVISGVASAYAAIPCFLTPGHGQFGATIGVIVCTGMLVIIAAQHSLNKNMFLMTAPAACVALLLNLFFLGQGYTAWLLVALGVSFIINARSLQRANAQAYEDLVSHQVEAQRALAQSQASEALYRILADNQTDVITLWDANGTRVYVSPSIERATGFTAAEILAQPQNNFAHPDDFGRLEQIISTLSVEDSPLTVEFRVACKDGSLAWKEATFQRLTDNSGGLISTARIITERKRLEEELVMALDSANEALKVKSDFLANMTHELRTPLNAIIGFSGLLKDSQQLSKGQARQVELVWDASQSLLRIVNDVLDFSKLEAGAVELELDTFDPEQLVSSTAAMLSGQALAKGLNIRVGVAGLEGKLLGDGARLRQVLTNLISNAIKFSSYGEIHVSASQKDTGENRCLHISVKDTGIGLKPDQIAKVFGRFSQADASISRKFGGTGLGLAISKRIIDAMGGEIGVESVPGQGSTFWFQVPLQIAEDVHAIECELQERPEIDRALRILVVEDNPVNRELICTLLGAFDLHIETANDGVEAIEALARSSFDVVLMDVHMPVMDGLAATRHIRSAADLEAPRLPIIAMTANVLPEHVARCLEAGMDDHIGKPIVPARLFETLARWTTHDSAANDHLEAPESFCQNAPMV